MVDENTSPSGGWEEVYDAFHVGDEADDEILFDDTAYVFEQAERAHEQDVALARAYCERAARHYKETGELFIFQVQEGDPAVVAWGRPDAPSVMHYDFWPDDPASVALHPFNALRRTRYWDAVETLFGADDEIMDGRVALTDTPLPGFSTDTRLQGAYLAPGLQDRYE